MLANPCQWTTKGPQVLGAVAGAHHVHTMAEAYGVTVILHTDHCARKLLPWVDGLLDAGERHFNVNRESRFSVRT
jgi:fructose-bisphosphate aldolase class II